MENKSISARPSREKRDPGFVKIRRGLLAHLPGMSSNAAKLYLWFHLKASWQPPKRGRVEASFDDMARGNGWSLKTLQRTIEELETMPFIEVERATNQYELTRIKNFEVRPRRIHFCSGQICPEQHGWCGLC